MSLAALKKSSSDFDTLNQKINSLMNPTRQDNDERFWQPTVDKAGNGSAIIRFLPPPEANEIPFVRVWDHGFKGPGGWYIENSLTTLDLPDPATEMNNQLWNSGKKEDKEFVSGSLGKQGSKRRLHFYSNILVVDDPANPKNNGKVFIYRYGKKIHNKLNNAMNPKFPNQPKINPWDMWNGANLILNIQKVEGQRNYDESTMDKPSPVASSDAKIETVWKQTYSLKEFVDPKNFKTYEQLKAKLDRVMSVGYAPRVDTVEDDRVIPAVVSKTVAPASAKEQLPPWESGEEDESDDELSQFKKLISG